MPRFRLKALSVGIAAAALGVSAPVWSEDEKIEEVVVTGSYIKRSSFEGTKPIQVIDQEAIRRSGAAQPVDGGTRRRYRHRRSEPHAAQGDVGALA